MTVKTSLRKPTPLKIYIPKIIVKNAMFLVLRMFADLALVFNWE